MNRQVVHSESDSALGAANPHQEGPPDLRLVPPAIGAWGAAALGLKVPGEWAVGGVLALLAVAGVLLGPTIRRRGRGAALSGSGSGAGARVLVATPEPAAPRPASSGPATSEPATSEPATGARAGPWWANRVAVAAVLLCAAAGTTAGALHAAEARWGPVPEFARQYAHATVELTLTSDPKPIRARAAWGGRSVVIQALVTRVVGPDGRAEQVRTPVLVIAPEAWQRLLPSTRVRVSTRLAPPRPNDTWAAAVVRVPERAAPQVVGEPTALQRMAAGLRGGLREAAEGLSPDARALLPGLVIGDTSRVTPELRDDFEATDLTHLMAVSGSNLVIVLVLLIGTPSRASLAERGGLAPRLGISLRATALLGGLVTVAFVVVCRPEPSVLRAAACGLVTLLAIATGRRRSLIPALAAAVLVLVLYAPELAGSYGFLLSVLATGALLTIAPGWSETLRRRGVPSRLAEVLAAAGAAQAVCAPVVAVFAARVSLVAVPCNLLAELAVAPATVLGFAALAVAPVAMPAAELLARCAGWPTEWIAGIARTGASLPGAQTGWPGGWGGGVLLAVVTAGVVFLVRRLPRHPWLAAGCAVLVLLAVVRPAPLTRIVTGWPPPGWVFAICDVGQGDATVLASGEGAAVVVDTGPDPAPADRCLRALGVTRIPLLLLTHFHADHVAGLAGVLRGRAVGVIETTTFEEPPEQARFVRRTAARAGVPVVPVEPGEWRAVGGLSWQALWPLPPPTVTPDGPNDASVTLLVRVGGLTLLLPGDLEPPAQQALLRAHPELPPVDVLKVAHHGSAHQDPALLRAVRPRLALISAGKGNPYGHPAPSTVALLASSGARVLRTDTDGAIAVMGRGSRSGNGSGSGPGGGLVAVPLGRGP
ncbi:MULTISPECIES: ComEC/Rec2 family competence protein [unclassified Streptomyces]|uniref:ComEC/Rec2 family competence protein n=1 Tax=unclassified Streptomyces TaxID=2593676 RepID=UPI0033F561D5